MRGIKCRMNSVYRLLWAASILLPAGLSFPLVTAVLLSLRCAWAPDLNGGRPQVHRSLRDLLGNLYDPANS